METITVCDVEYKLVKARDFEVIVRDDNGFINYTKLCQQINDGKKPFYNIKTNDEFKRLCIQMEFSSPGIPGDENDVSLYEQIKDRIEISVIGGKEGSELEKLRGTYMPRYLLDYVIMTCDISYYKLIHELMDVVDAVANKKDKKFKKHLQEIIDQQKYELQRRKDKIDELENKMDELIKINKDQMKQLQEQNKQIQEQNETLDTMYNMNQSQGVTIRRMDNKLLRITNATIAVHNEVSTIPFKDIKQHTTNDVLILYTSAEKPRDENLREHTPEGHTWISTFNGQRLNFKPPHIPRDRLVLLESHSNRLDSFKKLLERPNIARFIQDKTQYRELLVRNDQINEFIDILREELERDENYPTVANLEETLIVNPVNNEEIELKRRLLQQYNPCLINANRYKRRLYVRINDELRLIEDVETPENFEWIYKYGHNGRYETVLDLELMKRSQFTSELETRINYE